MDLYLNLVLHNLTCKQTNNTQEYMFIILIIYRDMLDTYYIDKLELRNAMTFILHVQSRRKVLESLLVRKFCLLFEMLFWKMFESTDN